VLLAAAMTTAAVGERPERFIGVFENGDRVAGAKLRNWARPGDKPSLSGRRLLDAQNPLRWLCDTSLSDASQPAAFVEFTSGDRLPGSVVFSSDAGSETPGVSVRSYLVVESGARLRNSRNAILNRIRVARQMVRRIVWEARRTPVYTPNTLRCRNGRWLRFRSARFRRNSVVLLLDAGTAEIPFDELAELNLAQAEPWDACRDELAVLSPCLDDRLVQLETTKGVIATASVQRFRPMPYNDRENPDRWYHLIHAAWSLDAFAVPCGEIRIRRYFRPEHVPMTRIKPVRTENRSMICSLWRYQTNRNVAGCQLASGGRLYGWGFGVHGESRLEFILPPIAAVFRTRIGIDRLAGVGGCVRTAVSVHSTAVNSSSRLTGSHATLHTSGILVGSRKTIDTGTLSLPGNQGARRRLVLSVDPMNRNHPDGADPLDIRDSLDWLEPTVELDRRALSAELRRRLVRCIPAWRGWSPGKGWTDRAKLVGLWDAMSGQGANYRFAVRTGKGAKPLVLTRKVTVGPGNVQLTIVAARLADMSDPAVIKVSVNGRQVGAGDLPIRCTGDEEPEALRISLDEWLNRDIVLKITVVPRKPGAANLVIDWRVIALTGRLTAKNQISRRRFVSQRKNQCY